MCRALEYCKFDIPSSWDCSPDLNLLVSYSLVPKSEEWDDDDNASCETHLHSHLPANFQRRTTDDTEPFELTFRTLPNLNVGIVGVLLCCGARTVECYAGADGYLMTARGTPLIINDGANTDDDYGNLYYDRIKFEDPIETLSLKFFGHGEGTCLKFYRMDFIVQKLDGRPGGPNGMGTLDLNKVKGYLHNMGDEITENARDLLQAVEQYQESQSSTLQTLQSALTNTSAGSDNSDKLSGLLAMASKLGTSPTVSQSCDCGDKGQSDTCARTRDVKRADRPTPFGGAGGAGAMGMLMTQMLGDSTAGLGSPGGDGMMHQMLQSICKTVGSMRVKENSPPSDTDVEADVTEQQLQNSNGNEAPIESKTNGTAVNLSVDTAHLEVLKTLEETVLSEVTASEERLKTYIDTKLADLETNINKKLDNILQVLKENR